MLLRNTTAVVLIKLGFMSFGISYERDSGMGGGGTVFSDFLKRELKVIKSEEQYPIFIFKV